MIEFTQLDFINETKETNITSKTQLTLKLMFKSSKNVDKETEMFLKSKSITIRVVTSIEGFTEALYESKAKVFRLKSTASGFRSFAKFTYDKSKNKQYS